MITIKSKEAIENIRYACNTLKKVHSEIRKNIKVGSTGLELDKIANKVIYNNKCEPNFLGYHGFPNSICVSINNQLVHGIPSNYKFQSGDIVSIDAGCSFNGYHSDGAFTVIVGQANSTEDEILIETTQRSLEEAIKILKPGVRIGTIGHIIQKFVESKGFKLPTNYAGHGIGEALHEDPIIPNVGIKNTGIKLLPNMVICIEPMVQKTTSETKVDKDNWTVLSRDGCVSAHFEHTILITEVGCEILT